MEKRVIAVHDISCVGRCSLTVALPILSAAEIETSVLPTAVLSTHTGGFAGYTYRDLTEDILPILDHWQSLALRADAVYTGYLGSAAQLARMETLFDRFPDAARIIDPVMGDGGRLYSGFDSAFVSGMRRLIRRADIITPNLTEAALLLGEAYQKAPDETQQRRMLRALSQLGPRRVILSGVSDGDRLGAASYDRVTEQYDTVLRPRLPGEYHGAGDVFGSALTAGLVNGWTAAEAMELAVDFTVEAVARTARAGTDTRYGLLFEAGLGDFARRVKRSCADAQTDA